MPVNTGIGAKVVIKVARIEPRVAMDFEVIKARKAPAFEQLRGA